MIAHLRGREAALEPFGWTGRRAEWIALACLHSGVFTRAQWARFADAHPEQVRRGVHALINRGVAAEETVPGIRGIGRVCRIFARSLYRALGAEHIRHRRGASTEVLMRRLLSLDYVLEHPGLPWLPTEHEKVGAFQALGLERALLPSRLYRGAAGDTRRYFPVKLPVALDSPPRRVRLRGTRPRDRHRAPFMGQAHTVGSGGRSKDQGRSVEVVAVTRTSRETERARRVMRGWAEVSGPAEPDAEIRRGGRPDRARDSQGRGPDPRGVRRLAGRHEAQRRAYETGAPAAPTRVHPPRPHLADGASRGGSLPMTGARLTAGLRCENDVRGRFTLWPPGDSHRTFRRSAGAVASCASAARPGVAGRAARAVVGATPQSEGLVRARGQVWIHTCPPARQGVAPTPAILPGRVSDR